ncbi:PspC domain-containing protein [Nocardioides sp.]|uniref:PspC domain-containing protein n=1 Tax=Nocardioides sp. TaxID=35761 RepID=UPI00352742C9
MTTAPPEEPTGGTSTATPPETGSGPDQGYGPRVTTQQMRDVSRLRRTILADRKIAGVAGGLARHFDVDPLIVRVALVVLALFGGSGVLLYGALWLLLPEDGAGSAVIRLDERSLGVALIGVGVVAGLALLGTWSDARWVSWPLALIALVVLLIASSRERRPAAPPQPYAGPYAGQPYPPPGTPAAAPPPPAYAGPQGAPMTTTPVAGPPSSTTGRLPSDAGTGQLPPAPPFPPTAGWNPPPPPPVRDPRRRGPLLVWITLALMVLGIGVLGMIDVAGTDVAPSAYPALATAIAAVMLLVGAFYGRAGGIIFLGLVSATALAGATIGERIETDQTTVRPLTAGAVDTTYSQAAGELVYDFSDVTDPAALDGQRIALEQGAGRIEVIVPRNVDVQTTTSIGAGSAQVFGATRDGLGLDFSQHHDVPNEVATVYLDIQLGFGEVDVHMDPLPTAPQETR